MAIVEKYGKPHYFVTMTCNPNCPEIKDNLGPRQKVQDRPDLVARVFRQQIKEACDDNEKKQIFGRVQAMIYVIEFQKRGLPHAHILIILHKDDVPKTAKDIDSVICAEMPNPVTHPKLGSIVTRNMIHGPCGKDFNFNSPCMESGFCTKDFPKAFAEETLENFVGYPVYRRRDTGSFRVGKHWVDNRWVVP